MLRGACLCLCVLLAALLVYVGCCNCLFGLFTAFVCFMLFAAVVCCAVRCLFAALFCFVLFAVCRLSVRSFLPSFLPLLSMVRLFVMSVVQFASLSGR